MRKAGGHAYVVQKHAATRLHYDFRLELGGVLKSWAVTKGPSLDPADRRLAVHVEDHPLEYGAFEGVVPAGEYGGGTVMVWDRGTWEPIGDAGAGYAAGKLRFVLKGRRLKGRWLLVRMRGHAAQRGRDNWLLIKENDRYARPGAGDAPTVRFTTSVASGRTMDRIVGAKRGGRGSAERPRPPIAAASPGTSRATVEALEPSRVAGARRDPLPAFVAPQLAVAVDTPPKAGDWLHEIKIDGYRAYCRRRGGEVRFFTRSGQDWTDRFRALAPAVGALPDGDLALDGEIAVFDERGVSSFGALQAALSAKRGNRLVYIVFDLLYLGGYDLRGARLMDRKSLLERLLAAAPKGGALRYSEHLRTAGPDVFAHACDLALEGIVSKRADRPYVEGRTSDWLKAKCFARQEFVVCGYTPPKRSGRVGFASLILGYYEGERLRYAGRVGTGFDRGSLRDLASRLVALRADKPPIEGPLPPLGRGNAVWVRPELVCEVEFSGWTRDGVLRQPAFRGLRDDKPPSAVCRERVAASPRRRAAAAAAAAAPGARPRMSAALDRGPGRTERTVAGVVISHPERAIFPGTAITKEALAEYYRSVADWILPEIVDRPLTLVRCPTGAGGPCFFQKHFATGMKTVPRVAIREKGSEAQYLVVRNVRDLVAVVQEGVIEIHPWGARTDDPDRPDRMTFDLDPAPDVGFAPVVEAAIAMRDMLAGFDLAAFARTTGGKGMHVVVPLRRGLAWPDLKAFARALAETFARGDPARFTATPTKRSRTGRIFIDYLRNARGATAVAGYSARARPGAPVAMPLAWKEVEPRLDPRRFTVATVPPLLAARRDPWRALYRSHQTIPARAFKALGID